MDLVYNLCLHYLHHTQEAEEACQDVFLKIHASQAQFKAKSSFKTWIYRLTINHCLDCIKSKGRIKRKGQLVPLTDDLGRTSLPLFSFDHPGVRLEDKEATEQIMSLIYGLAENQQTAIILKAIEGLPQQEIAEIMGVKLKALESLLQRAKKNLDQLLLDSKDSEYDSRLS